MQLPRIGSFMKLGALLGVFGIAMLAPVEVRALIYACGAAFAVGAYLKGEIQL